MPNYRQDFDRYSKELVKIFTEFDESDENFQLCLDFVLSNFKHHRFLDVDKHKVKRSLAGIKEKFTVHSQDVKAEEFDILVEKYIQSTIHEDKDFSTTDKPFCVLSLLLLLADEPTSYKYRKRERTPDEVIEENFDWKEYLLEGEEPIRSFRDDSDSDSDSDWGDLNAEKSTKTPKTVQIDLGEDTDRTLVQETGGEEGEDGRPGLLKDIIVQYWDVSTNSSTTSDVYMDRTSSLITDVKAFLDDTSFTRELNEKHIITEYQLNRELLWILSGVKDSFVFQWDGKQFLPNVKVQLLHLSHQALRRCLLSLCTFGTIVQTLQQFYESVAFEQTLPKVTRAPCQTDQAFASAICEYLQNFKKEIVAVEKSVSAQKDCITVSSLVDQLSPRLQELELLSHIYHEGLESYIHCKNNSIRASHLLGVIYNTMLEYNTLSDDKQHQVCLLMSLWIKSVKPYLDIIDHWLTFGTLADPCREFIVERKESIRTRDENFWYDSLILHCPGDSVQHSPGDSPDLTTPAYTAPSFITPVIKEIVVAGKSTEMLRELGKLQEISADGKNASLHHQMTLAVRDFLCQVEDVPDSKAPRSLWSDSPSVRDQVLRQLHSSITSVRGIQDPLLRYNFSRLLADSRDLPTTEGTAARDRTGFGNMKSESFPPMQLLLQKCLYPCIHSKYEKVCTKLLHVLKTEHGLLSHLSTMRQYPLMEAGAAMYDFYTEIFDRVRLGEKWRDLSLLNTLIADAVGKGDLGGIEVRLEDSVAPRHGLSAMQGLTLHYDVPWPVNNVIHSKTMAVYNQVFAFLLQVKWVKYCLDELRFSALEKNPLVHKMQVFRMKLIHFVNSLHAHLMTRILHSTGLDFRRDLDACADLDEVITVHSLFVTKIHERCLLHKSVSLIKEVVSKVLNLAIYFCGRWETRTGTITAEGLASLEAEFSHCIKFLSSLFLSSLKKRGSLPHLESLAFSLITSSS